MAFASRFTWSIGCGCGFDASADVDLGGIPDRIVPRSWRRRAGTTVRICSDGDRPDLVRRLRWPSNPKLPGGRSRRIALGQRWSQARSAFSAANAFTRGARVFVSVKGSGKTTTAPRARGHRFRGDGGWHRSPSDDSGVPRHLRRDGPCAERRGGRRQCSDRRSITVRRMMLRPKRAVQPPPRGRRSRVVSRRIRQRPAVDRLPMSWPERHPSVPWRHGRSAHAA